MQINFVVVVVFKVDMVFPVGGKKKNYRNPHRSCNGFNGNCNGLCGSLLGFCFVLFCFLPFIDGVLCLVDTIKDF